MLPHHVMQRPLNERPSAKYAGRDEIVTSGSGLDVEACQQP